MKKIKKITIEQFVDALEMKIRTTKKVLRDIELWEVFHPGAFSKKENVSLLFQYLTFLQYLSFPLTNKHKHSLNDTTK